MEIKLNLINNSMERDNAEVVVFQKNVTPNFDEIAVAWRVIKNCGRGDNHPFVFPIEFQVCANDSWGNYTPRFNATNGQRWEMVKDPSGDVLQLSNQPATSMKEVQIANVLPNGAIGANIYRHGKLLATKTTVAPGSMAVFEFKPTIWVGVVSQVREGQIMNSAVISQVNTELSLLGISSADIVWTGGGPGPGSTPYQFHLENINHV